MKRNERRLALMDGAFDRDTVDGVDAVEHNEFDPCFGRSLHTEAHGGRVSIKATADVLNVVDQRVETLELFGRGRAARTIKTVHRKTCFFVGAVVNLLIELSTDAMLGAEECFQFHLWRFL